eukprot:scaffold43313_cov199-Amphora_coffeaeformis.AAC.1
MLISQRVSWAFGIWMLDGEYSNLVALLEDILTCQEGKVDTYHQLLQLIENEGKDQWGNVTHARGRCNLNLQMARDQTDQAKHYSWDDHFATTFQLIEKVQQEATCVANAVSRRWEEWLNLPKGRLQESHAQGRSSSLRLLDYNSETGTKCPPHTLSSTIRRCIARERASCKKCNLWFKTPAKPIAGIRCMFPRTPSSCYWEATSVRALDDAW